MYQFLIYMAEIWMFAADSHIQGRNFVLWTWFSSLSTGTNAINLMFGYPLRHSGFASSNKYSVWFVNHAYQLFLLYCCIQTVIDLWIQLEICSVITVMVAMLRYSPLSMYSKYFSMYYPSSSVDCLVYTLIGCWQSSALFCSITGSIEIKHFN